MNYIYRNFNLLISNRKIILHDVFVQLQSIFNSTNINHGQSYPIFGFWLKLNNTNSYNKLPVFNKFGLKILSWNIQSSKNKLGSKFEDANLMKILYEQEILCLQEVRQSKKIPGFRTKSKLRNGEKMGGQHNF